LVELIPGCGGFKLDRVIDCVRYNPFGKKICSFTDNYRLL
jgi:hypothetical protein